LTGILSQTRSGARPKVVLGLLHHARPDGIALDVRQGLPEVRGLDRARVVARLPDVATGPLAQIEVVGTIGVGAPRAEAMACGRWGTATTCT